jgi:hypothetical protein
MPNREIIFNEVLIGTVETMVEKVALSVASAQKRLDAAALESQKKLAEEHPQLAQLGYQVTWYQMPEVEVELKMAVHYEKSETTGGSKSRIFVSPYNAKYKSNFSYTAEGASTLKFRIVPVPPQVFSLPGEKGDDA